MVGATGFEPATTCTPSKCATRLRYAPARNCGGSVVASAPDDVNGKGELLRAVERVLQHLRRAERQHLARADLDLLAGLRIASHARLFLAHHEVAEAGKLDLLTLLQRVLQGVEHHLDHLGRLLLGEPDLAADAFDDVGFSHARNPTRAPPSGSNTKGNGHICRHILPPPTWSRTALPL